MTLAIGHNRISVVIRGKGSRRDTPHVLVVLLHRHRFRALASQFHLLSVRSAKAEGDAFIRMDLRRYQRRQCLWRWSCNRLGLSAHENGTSQENGNEIGRASCRERV